MISLHLRCPSAAILASLAHAAVFSQTSLAHDDYLEAVLVAEGAIIERGEADSAIRFMPGTDLKPLAHLTGLGCFTEFELHQCKSTDEFLSAILLSHPIRSLDTSASDVEEAFTHVEEPLSLEVLTLDATEITDFSFLSRLPELRELSVAYTSFSDHDLEYLQNSAKLRTLNLSHSEVSPSGMDTIALLKDLRLLNISGIGVSDRHLPALKKLERSIEVLLSDKHPYTLEWGYCEMSDDALLDLRASGYVVRGRASPPRKYTVVLQPADGGKLNVEWTWDDLMRHSMPDAIREIDLANSDIDDAKVSELIRFRLLERLSVSGARITDHVWIPLQKFTILGELDVSNTRVSDLGIRRSVVSLPISSLNASNTRIVGTEINAERFPNLQVVEMQRANPKWPTVRQFPVATNAGIKSLLAVPSLREAKLSWAAGLNRDAFLGFVSQSASIKRIDVFEFMLTSGERSLLTGGAEVFDDSARSLFPVGRPTSAP